MASKRRNAIPAMAVALWVAAGAGAGEVPLDAPAHAAWTAIGRVNIRGYRTRSACTGALVAPDRVLTAAHCVFRGPRPAPAADIVFAAGWFRGQAAAVGRTARIALPRGWTPDMPADAGAVAADIALLTLAAPIETVRPLPLAGTGGGAMRILGYRWDRPHALTDHAPCFGTAAHAPALAFSCPAVPGTSGAPVLTFEDGRWAILAVTSARSDTFTLAAPLPADLLDD